MYISWFRLRCNQKFGLSKVDADPIHRLDHFTIQIVWLLQKLPHITWWLKKVSQALLRSDSKLERHSAHEIKAVWMMLIKIYFVASHQNILKKPIHYSILPIKVKVCFYALLIVEKVSNIMRIGLFEKMFVQDLVKHWEWELFWIDTSVLVCLGSTCTWSF